VKTPTGFTSAFWSVRRARLMYGLEEGFSLTKTLATKNRIRK